MACSDLFSLEDAGGVAMILQEEGGLDSTPASADDEVIDR
eukprot:CAMPEP_0183706564 /NCGR_PEP_ID=MMETSP0737-20130205/3340_1 /TAXON_ID=385413 /ORGANISM="Thalassiosira miniscula, Strain CCMP1093" /LENGTH=39 /DNA_ID= /DNA_START= /DNA_END= /DNA_ORIENTATION=